MGVGKTAFVTAGTLLTLVLLAFLSYGKFLSVNRQALNDFLDSEVGLATNPSDSPVVKTEPSSLPLFAKIFLPIGKPADPATGQNEVNFNTVKPSALPEDDFVVIEDNFFADQTGSGDGETEPGPLIKLVISEILFGTKDSAKEEFVEFYNPNGFAVELSGWELRKKTENGNDSVLVSSQKFSGAIRPKSYFLISHPDFSEKFGADLVWSSKSYAVSENNAIYLLDDFGRQIDLVGCGSAFDYESTACVAPETGVSVSRPVNADTDNNQNDFSFSQPSPKTDFIPYVQPAPSPQLSLPVSPSPSPVVVTPSPTPTLIIEVSPDSTNSPQASQIPEPSPEPTHSPPAGGSPTPEISFPQIIAVQVGLEGSVNSDFIKLHNPNSGVLDLKDYKLVKKTTSGTEYTVKSWRTEDESRRVVSGGEDFYWVNSGYQEKIDELASSGRKFFSTTATISETNLIILKYLDEQVGIW